VEAAITAQSVLTERQSQEISELKTEVKKVGDVITAMAVHNERLNMLQKDIDELRHGRGFVT
jgi:hypothetical protein